MWLTIDRTKETPIIRQIYDQFREKILCGELTSGERLPSTREISEFVHVSRNVILEAYELLEIEGFILTKPQSGTYVAKSASFLPPMVSTQKILPQDVQNNSTNDLLDLRSGIPALDLLPLKKWNAYHSEVILNSTASTFGYGTANGSFALRKSISDYLLRMRGMVCNPEQIIITSGSLHSFSILSQILCQNNNTYIIEDPLHIEIKKVLANVSTNRYTIPVDNFGMQTNLLPPNIFPAFVFVTPSHQYPLGGTLPIQRRIELIQFARQDSCYIIEDDYDSEYRYAGTPASTLFGLDSNRVIYVGTFSKVLFPTVRISYMVLPPSLLEKTVEFVRYHDYCTDMINQLTLAQMLNNRDVDRHISKMKKLYKKRRDYLVKLLLETFDSKIVIHGSETGLHLIVEFRDYEFTDNILEEYRMKGLLLYPVWHHSDNAAFPKNLLIMGYSHLDDVSIKSAVSILASLLRIENRNPEYLG